MNASKVIPAPAAREVWLHSAIERLRDHFAAAGFTIPRNVRVSCGLPSSGAFGTRKRTLGEAWSAKNTSDDHHEIFISPTQDDAGIVLSVLTHELVHVTVGLKAGHRGAFVGCARAVGLMGPWTSTTANDELAAKLKDIGGELGKYPHGSLTGMTNRKKKQTTRLIKCGCPACGYTTRITMQWILTGLPNCPNIDCDSFGEPFEAEIEDGGESR